MEGRWRWADSKEGSVTGGNDVGAKTGEFGKAGRDGDPSRMCREMKNRTNEEGDT